MVLWGAHRIIILPPPWHRLAFTSWDRTTHTPFGITNILLFQFLIIHIIILFNKIPACHLS